ncbi:MAG: hypothetical protein EPO21_03885 [Chloroflexota bacterium]|nr:MAG: hypothetical protein EPO21_03885 [Chloroflexota bacterium]
MKTSGKDDRPKLWSTRNPSWLPVERTMGDMVVLGDGAMVAALEVFPVDTALMSQEEVQTYIVRFWQGLRTLHFPVSMYVGTRRQNVASYLERATQRLDRLAESQSHQDGFFGMLLEEQCRLLEVLLTEHLRSRYTLLVVSQSSASGLKGMTRSLIKPGDAKPLGLKTTQDVARGELELKLKKIDDLLRHIGLKYTRCSGKGLALELLRLSRPDFATDDHTTLEAHLEPQVVVRGDLKGDGIESGFPPQR